MKSIIGNIVIGVRQWRYPKSFRIPTVRSVAFEKEFADTLKALRKTLDIFSNPATVENIMKFTAADDYEFIAELLTRLWRFKKSITIGDTVNSEVPANYNQLERIFSIFEKMDFHIEDREGDIYDSGLTMKVIASEPMEGIGREVIKETYKPGIYRGSTLIQVPEIIVGLPIIEMPNESDLSETSKPNKDKKNNDVPATNTKDKELNSEFSSEEANEESSDENESRLQ